MSDEAIVHIIDDYKSIREALEALFQSVDLRAKSYASVADFLANYEDGPGCLVLDIRLPGFNGLDFQGHMMRSGISLPVILMSGFGDVPMTQQAKKAGAVTFLSKPFQDQDMLNAVVEAFKIDRERRQKST